MLSEDTLRGILSNITYPGWRFELGFDGYFLGRAGVQQAERQPWVRVAFEADGEMQYGRKWRISWHMTKSEVVQTCFLAVMTAIEHEVREAFRYKGRPIFGPHFDVDKLHEMTRLANLDLRDAAE